jgi:hypothetical protein
MKKSLLLLAAFAFVGLAGCASEEETDITVDEDTADTMMTDTTMADTTGM